MHWYSKCMNVFEWFLQAVHSTSVTPEDKQQCSITPFWQAKRKTSIPYLRSTDLGKYTVKHKMLWFDCVFFPSSFLFGYCHLRLMSRISAAFSGTRNRKEPQFTHPWFKTCNTNSLQFPILETKPSTNQLWSLPIFDADNNLTSYLKVFQKSNLGYV